MSLANFSDDVLFLNLTAIGNMTSYDLAGQNKTIWRLVGEGTLLSLISLCAVFGNSLVILSVYGNRKLRTVTNCFVVSLATADLLVGLLVLPLSIKVEVTGTWRLGSVLCDLWISCDVMLCTASILNLCCISVDRFFAITRPLAYATKRSKKLALVMIAVVWIVSIIITCPPILGWQEEGRGHVDVYCYLTKDPGYVVYSSLGSFYIPLLVMIFVYARILHVTRKRNKMLKPYCTTFVFDKNRGFKRWHRQPSCGSHTAAPTCGPVSVTSCPVGRGNGGGAYSRAHVIGEREYEREDESDTDPECGFAAAAAAGRTHSRDRNFEAHPLRILRSASPETPSTPNEFRGQPTTDGAPAKHHVTVMCDGHARATTSLENSSDPERDYFLGREEKRRERAVLRRESKTAKTLAIVVGCFVVCWLPFFLMYVIEPFCAPCDFDPGAMTLVTWLGYCNSVLNPLIYAFYNRDFRSSFWRLTFGLLIKDGRADPCH
ncbi:hypothetical protein LSH36_788g01000 [Paralvinella palmiformis]|uniref:G-protein coupled receptors family 1 profile domain-containing protein n=1 Tax=Paralvinella palmiformis TaxID=53620 RepID=A0AAD9MU95_9ANNE|nr:hypothetical protein LSH36_788g01000 [Paralvinella palmiformis]